jgi:hypothetical protein
MRIDLEDASNPDGVLWAGRLIVGNGWQAPYHMQAPPQISRRSGSTKRRSTMDGTLGVREVESWAHAEFPLSFLTDQEHVTHGLVLQRQLNLTRDLLVLSDTPSLLASIQYHTFYSVLEDFFDTSRPQYNRWEWRVRVEGLI